jgi:hypothetical protein
MEMKVLEFGIVKIENEVDLVKNVSPGDTVFFLRGGDRNRRMVPGVFLGAYYRNAKIKLFNLDDPKASYKPDFGIGWWSLSSIKYIIKNNKNNI